MLALLTIIFYLCLLSFCIVLSVYFGARLFLGILRTMIDIVRIIFDVLMLPIVIISNTYRYIVWVNRIHNKQNERV